MFQWHWYFVVLEGNVYVESLDYDATKEDIFNIAAIPTYQKLNKIIMYNHNIILILLIGLGLSIPITSAYSMCYVIYDQENKSSKEYSRSPIDLSVSISDGLSKCGLDGYSMMIQDICPSEHFARKFASEVKERDRLRSEIRSTTPVPDLGTIIETNDFGETSTKEVTEDDISDIESDNENIMQHNAQIEQMILESNKRLIIIAEIIKNRTEKANLDEDVSPTQKRLNAIADALDNNDSCIDSLAYMQCTEKGTEAGKKVWQDFKTKTGTKWCTKLEEVNALMRERLIKLDFPPCNNRFNQALEKYIRQQLETVQNKECKKPKSPVIVSQSKPNPVIISQSKPNPVIVSQSKSNIVVTGAMCQGLDEHWYPYNSPKCSGSASFSNRIELDEHIHNHPQVINANKGMTWGSHPHDNVLNIDTVTCHGKPLAPTDNGSCNAYNGDTSCNAMLPVLCLKIDGSPKPNYVTPTPMNDSRAMPPEYYDGWAGGQIAITHPIIGTKLTSVTTADKICSDTFGAGWRMAEHHDGGGGWAFKAYGNVRSDTRYWVRVNDQPSNCWN